jgi:hypothetical protein
MTKTEETYAAWLNILGSGTVQPPAVAQDLHAMHDMARSTSAAEHLASAYMDVLLALIPQTGPEQAAEAAWGLVAAARAQHVRYTPGLPLVIDGVDCSPEHVRLLEGYREDYRRSALGMDTAPHWVGCLCSQTCRDRGASA